MTDSTRSAAEVEKVEWKECGESGGVMGIVRKGWLFEGGLYVMPTAL